jgi:hypothetical protein
MCLVCIEYANKTLGPQDALRNLEEMRSIIKEDHYYEVYDTIYDELLEYQMEEMPLYELDPDIGFGD